MVMQAQCPGGVAPSPAAHNITTGQAHVQTEKSLNYGLLPMQQYMATWNPFVIQPVPIPNSTSPPMVKQQHTMVSSPLQPKL